MIYQDVSNFSRVSLLAINQLNLKNNAITLQNNLNGTSYSIHFQLFFMALDIIESKIFKLKLKECQIVNFKAKKSSNKYL